MENGARRTAHGHVVDGDTVGAVCRNCVDFGVTRKVHLGNGGGILQLPGVHFEFVVSVDNRFACVGHLDGTLFFRRAVFFLANGIYNGLVDIESDLEASVLVRKKANGAVTTDVAELLLAFFAALDSDGGVAFKFGELSQRSVACMFGFVFFGAKQNVARKGADACMACAHGRNRHNGGHHAGACATEFVLQVFANGCRDSVFFELRVAVMHYVYNVRIETCKFKMQEESVKPRGVVAWQIEARFALFEKVLVKLERIAEGGKLFSFCRFHHFTNSFFRVALGGIAERIAGGLLYEDFRELRVAERRVANVDSVIGVDDGDKAQQGEQANDRKEDF